MLLPGLKGGFCWIENNITYLKYFIVIDFSLYSFVWNIESNRKQGKPIKQPLPNYNNEVSKVGRDSANS